MFITIGENQYELSTKLGTGKRIEAKFGQPINKIFGNLDNALTTELVSIITIAANKVDNAPFVNEIYDNWDYTDIYASVQELIVRLMYGGTPEQNEAKIEKSAMPEQQKNAIRGLLGIPIPKAPETAVLTGNE